MVKIGILGANGFIGNRTLEILSQNPTMTICPIFRTAASMYQSLYSGLDCRIANALDQSALEKAFHGCEVVIHTVLGSPGMIRGSVKPGYRAAQKAGVRRLIYLSSMCVHSQCPPPDTTEASPVSKNGLFPYNSAKIYAEKELLELRNQGSVEVVIFRPGIVFGPRSRWVSEIAAQLLQGTAYLINEGKGICNTVYVDNLVEAIQLAVDRKEADGQAFFIGDKELVTWSEFYRPFAEAIGIDLLAIPSIDVPKFDSPSYKQKLWTTVWDSNLAQKTLSLFSDEFKRTIKKAFLNKNSPPDLQSQSKLQEPQIIVTSEMSLLQQSQYKLPYEKAEKLLGYKPVVSFSEGCRRSIDWLIQNNFLI